MQKLNKYKRKYLSSTKKNILIFLLLVLMIGVGYSYLEASLSIVGNVAVQMTNYFPEQIHDVIEDDNCMVKYEGQVTDQVNNTVTASKVYFNKCENARNIIFNNMCWQMIRTTETGGIKMIYNGEPVNGKCESSRGNHKGIIQVNNDEQNMSSSFLYGSTFIYDTTNNTFRLMDTEMSTWSDSTYENLIGKFTCMSSIDDVCITMYQINGYKSNTIAYASAYIISDTNYASIGTSSFNANYYSPAMVGYMFNKTYGVRNKAIGTNTYKYGSTFTYSNGTYTLSGTTQTISDWSTGYNQINNTHYTCWNTTGTCSEISFIYMTTDLSADYINLTNGENVNDALEKMLSSDDVNKYNSSAKGIVDNWYYQKLSHLENLLEDTVYCNNRNIISNGGWAPYGNLNSEYSLRFKNYNVSTDLSCTRLIDQFSVSNNKAKLKYPIALLEAEEGHNIGSASLMSIGTDYWRMSPYFVVSYARVRYLSFEGATTYEIVNKPFAIRPTITLKSSTKIVGGTGSETDPWIVDEVNYPTQIKELVDNESCITSYEGEVTDKVGVTKTAKHVHFNRCSNKRNIILNNMCFQMIRTTENGGIKMIYNGDAVNGKCESTRGDHKGIVGANGSTETLNVNYLYGDSFTYDITNNTFTLVNPFASTWSDSTYENLLGKFTCKNINGTCTTIYNINGYESNTSAYTSSYTIGNTNYATIGASPFNASSRSPSSVGYMFNKMYDFKARSPGTNTFKYGSSFTYSNGTYTLSGATKNISDWSVGYTQINNTHYTCWNTSGTCSEIAFIYYTTGNIADFVSITGGKGINDALEEMLSNDNVNRYDSSVKGIIDSWYAQNLYVYTDILEDAVYCNARNIDEYGGWSDSGNLFDDYFLKFKNYNLNYDLSCTNLTDQFSVSNNKAKLKYPVALLEAEEGHNISSASLMLVGTNYWRMSPAFSVSFSRVRYLSDIGGTSYDTSDLSFGVRPVITLKNGVDFSSGDGSEGNPWIVEE